MGISQGSTQKDDFENPFKVSLRTATNYPYANREYNSTTNVNQKRGRINTTKVIFDVTPDLNETRTVDYKTQAPIHMPGQILTYGGTASRTFSLSSIKLISRTIAEATQNMQNLWLLRSWTMPYFGERSSSLNIHDKAAREVLSEDPGTATAFSVDGLNEFRGQELLGKPPEVLLLNAYSNTTLSNNDSAVRKFPTNISNIPVVMTDLTIPYPSDVDYIPTEDGQPFPRLMIVDIQLKETRAPRELSKRFSLQDYRRGILPGF